MPFRYTIIIIYRKRYAVGPRFERPSRIVAARRLRKSSARVALCFVGHRFKKQSLIAFCSLTGSGAPKRKTPPCVVFFFLERLWERTLIRKANGMFAYRLRYLRREEQQG